jgi:hypothetical protein
MDKELNTINKSGSLVSVDESRHMGLIESAISKGADIQTIEKLMELHNKFEEKQARKAFFAALSDFQSDLPTIKKEGSVNYGKTKYNFARLEDIARTISPKLKQTGLSYTFQQSQEGGVIAVKCIVTHKLGHSESNKMQALADSSGQKNAIQQIGSTLTYLKRYTLIAGLGLVVADDDDDAQSYQQQQSAQRDQHQTVSYYPQSEFEKNLPNWLKSIENGKTVDQLIEFVGKRGFVFTDKQKHGLGV